MINNLKAINPPIKISNFCKDTECRFFSKDGYACITESERGDRKAMIFIVPSAVK